MSRPAKQFVYGVFYLLILAAVGYGVYARYFKTAPGCTNGQQDSGEQGVDCGGVCAHVCVAQVAPLEAGTPQYFTPDNSHLEFLVKIKNPNQAVAAKSFSYMLRLAGDAGELYEIRGTSFIQAGQIRYLAAFWPRPQNLPASARAEFSIDSQSIQWVTSDQFPAPPLRLRDFQTSVASSTVSTAGHLANDGAIALSSVQILSLFYNSLGLVVGVSGTQLDNLAANEVRPFVITHPLILDLAASSTQVVSYSSQP